MELSRLHQRLRLAAGDRSHRAVGELTGHKTETVRRYLTGQPPSVEFLAAFVHAFGLRADWLLLGRGPAHRADEHAHALKQATPDELLSALAETVELIQARLDRIERYVHTLEARTRGVAHLISGASDQPTKARKRDPDAPAQPGQPQPADESARDRAQRVADAIARRSPQDAH